MDFPHRGRSQPPEDGKNIEFGGGRKRGGRPLTAWRRHLDPPYDGKNRKSTIKIVLIVTHRPLAGHGTDPVRLCWSCSLDIHLIDGTYELFRHYYALPSARDGQGREVAAVRGVLASVLGMIRGGATHVAVATDHVIESFRNGLWAGYKTSEGVEPDLLAQFPLLEEVLTSAGMVVWPMTEFEADDALAAGAAAARDARVERVVIYTPDKDLAQCVRGTRIVQMNRRTRVMMDEAGVVQKFGVAPESIPDYLALVGDAADGYPGLPGWGARLSAAVLAKFRHLESIPADWREWSVTSITRAGLRIRWAASGSRRCCSGRSRRCGPTSRSSTMSRSCAGMGPSRGSRNWEPGSTRR